MNRRARKWIFRGSGSGMSRQVISPATASLMATAGMIAITRRPSKKPHERKRNDYINANTTKRTATGLEPVRAGEAGRAITFAAPEERNNLRSIERLIRKTLPILDVPMLPEKRGLPPQEMQNYSSPSTPNRNRFSNNRQSTPKWQGGPPSRKTGQPNSNMRFQNRKRRFN